MNRLQLATLLSWADEAGFDGRKRLQKVVFFLQRAGCTLDCDYILHRFGPYSFDVADTCDGMVAAGLIDEHASESGEITRYSYTLPQRTHELMAQSPDTRMQEFEELGKRLIHEDIWPLELGSTILYFLDDRNEDWEGALNKACKYKAAEPTEEPSRKALQLAQSLFE